MTRVGRYALGALTLLSLLLFVATAATWAYVSGRPGPVDYAWSSASRQWHLDLRLRGDIFLHVSRRSARVVASHIILRHVEVPGLWYDHELLSDAPAGSVEWGVVNVKYWLAFAAFGLLPVGRGGIAGVRRLRTRPPPPGACASYGYDLRATPERCPECGTVPNGEGKRDAPDDSRPTKPRSGDADRSPPFEPTLGSEAQARKERQTQPQPNG